ncbi:MAG TPA: hypothetical protein VF590_16890 [Isosphaeraceae bacterium]|jgi:hypothetical protein
MLPITRPRRQALATLALLAVSVTPTAYVTQLAWKVNRPGHRRDVEVEIGRQLGLQVTLEGVRYPRPGEVVYRGAVLWQVEPRQKRLAEIARAATVRVRRGDRQLTLQTEGLRLHGEGPELAMAQVGALLQRAGADAWDRVSLAAPTCEVELGDGGPETLRYSFRDLVGTFQADRGAPRVTASYRLVGDRDGSANRCELVLTRDRGGKTVRTSIAFKTADGLPLPARVLDPFFASAPWLGPDARVQGTLALEQDGASPWGATFQGILTDVDLAALVGRWSPEHRLRGRARVEIAAARWADRWVEASGTLATGPGTISPALLGALKSEMSFRLAGPLEARHDDVAFDRLALRFAMSPDGQLQLAGGLGTEFDPDVVLVGAGRLAPLAKAPDGAANVLGLIKTLTPLPADDPTILVPFTPESQALQRYLPVPAGAARVNTAVGN